MKCDKTRINGSTAHGYFQVVFLHPELWDEAGGDWRAAAGFVQQPRRAG